MKIRMRTAVAGLATLTLALAGPVGLVQATGNQSAQKSIGQKSAATKVITLDPSNPDLNPEGVAWDPRSQSFFVGIVSTGTIYRATLHDKKLKPFITPSADLPADSAVGMKVFGGKLYVAGGPTGSIYVYSTRTGRQLARFETGSGGFLNDLVVTPNGDVYVTDSFRPTLWRVSSAKVKAGRGTPEAISIGDKIAYTAGMFNLNGIVVRRGGRELIVVNSFSKSLFRIDLNRGKPGVRAITKIDAPALGGDGLLIDRGRLLVVIGSPARVEVLSLSRSDLRARIVKTLKDGSLRGPSTIARANNRYLVVNADFAGDEQPFTVSSIPRR
jgi:sugar lactone lactonase YvrE